MPQAGRDPRRKGNGLHAVVFPRMAIVPARAVGLAPLTGASTLTALRITAIAAGVACLLVALAAYSVVAMVAGRAFRIARQVLRQPLTSSQSVGRAGPARRGPAATAAIAAARRPEDVIRTHRYSTSRTRGRENAAIRGVTVAASRAGGVASQWARRMTVLRHSPHGERATEAQPIRLIARFTGTRADRFTADSVDARRGRPHTPRLCCT